MKPALPNVTLICIDHLPERGASVVERCLALCDFGGTKLLSPFGSHPLLHKIPSFSGFPEFSAFCLRQLKNWFTTSHCLFVQHDGYVMNPLAWSDEFLEYDYIGAPWHDRVVGNGGFSLRSKRLAEITAADDFPTYTDLRSTNEDLHICRYNRAFIEAKGAKFAPYAVAAKFSAEIEPYTGQFGFHTMKHPIMRAYYRISNNSTRRNRLKCATKENCFNSFLKEFSGNPITVIQDGVTDENLKSFLSAAAVDRYVTTCLGTAASYCHALSLACEMAATDEEYAYFAEDDYLYLPSSCAVIKEGLGIANYATLYDHPDKYVNAEMGGNPQISDGGEKTTVVTTKSSHWKHTNSTTSTFGVRIGVLKEDLETWKKHARTEAAPGWDYTGFCELIKNGRTLISSIPGMATHCDADCLSPFTDWDSRFKL